MKNNIFHEQQENAFYEHDFKHFTTKDLDQMVGKYRAKSNKTEFPSPDCIFHKRFHFLSKPSAVQQVKSLSESKTKPSPEIESRKKKTLPLTPQKTDPKKEGGMSNGTPQIVKRNDILVSEIKKSKLGVQLESESDSDTDNFLIIPPKFDEIIKSVLSGKKLDNEKDLETLIETTPINKEEFEEKTKWVNELILSDNEIPDNTSQNLLITSYLQAELSPVFSL